MGKFSSFPDAGGILKPVEGAYKLGEEFHQAINPYDSRSFTLSDHIAPYAELYVEGTSKFFSVSAFYRYILVDCPQYFAFRRKIEPHIEHCFFL